MALLRNIIPLLIIAGLFIGSMYVRLPNMGRPLGDHHEWVTQHTLIILKNWEKQGALKHKFCLLMTFQGKNNRWIYDYFSRLVNKHGQGYYVSFPPGAVVAPYLAFKALDLPVNSKNLQMFNVICHFLTALVFYWMLKNLLSSNYYPKEAVAVIGTSFFVFLPNLLWFFSNVYSWDTFWCYLLIIQTALTLKLKQLIDARKPHKLFLLLFCINLFFLIYSDYYGLLLSFVIMGFAAGRIKQSKTYLHVLTAAFIVSLLSFSFIVLQYSSINGIKSLISCILSNKEHYAFLGMEDIKTLFAHAWNGFKIILVPITAAFIYLLFQEKKNIFSTFSSDERSAVLLSLIPAILFFTIQIRWSAEHNYSMLRLAPFLIIFLTILISKIRLPLYWSGYILIAILLWEMVGASVSSYEKKFAHSIDKEFFYRQGTYMRENSSPDEVLFAFSEDYTVDPRFTYYARRNVQIIDDLYQAFAWLNVHQREKAAIFNFSADQPVTGPQRIDIQADKERLFAEKGIVDFRFTKGKFNRKAKAEFIKQDGSRREIVFRNGMILSDTDYDSTGAVISHQNPSDPSARQQPSKH